MTSAGPVGDPARGDARTLGELLRSLEAPPEPGDRWRAASEPLHVPSRPDTVVWGEIPIGRTPVATVGSGSRLRIDTVSHQGMLTTHPVEFFGAFGVAETEVLPDVVEIYEQVERAEGASSHVLTGPIEIEAAEPGDVVEVRIVDAELRVDYGINHSQPGSGVLPGLLTSGADRLLRTDASGSRLVFDDGVSIPTAPFPGIVALAPAQNGSLVPSRPPGRCGGNLDLKELTAGSRLFLPVFQPGAQFFIGDPHAAQGDGEVNGTAAEHSSSYTLDLLLHKRLQLPWPVAETSTHLITTGIDAELSVALELAVQSTIELLLGVSAGALDPVAAYALCSVAVDFGIAEAVNGTSVARAKIPRGVVEGWMAAGVATRGESLTGGRSQMRAG